MAVASRQATGLLIALMVTFSIIGGIICFIMLRMIGGIIKELGNSEARFRRLAENAPDVIYRMALPGGNYEYMSPAAETVFGHTPETFYMKPQLIREIIHPDWRNYFIAQWENLVAGVMPPFYEYQIIHQSGETRWVNQRNVLIRDEAGQPAAIEGIVTDITERKAWEAEREQLSQELRQAHKMEAVGTLAGGIAHDFNNILSSILGNAELVKRQVTAGSLEEECIDEVLMASFRARDLVSRILSFSRGDIQERVPVRLQGIVEETLLLLRASLPATVKIATRFVVESGAVLAEPTQIHQVVMNLCTNAAQAMEPQGGRLNIALDEVDITDEDDGAKPVETAGCYVRLTVSDTGPGIAPKISERIFDPYFTTKPTGKGSGMGLAVVHGIVANNGGAVTVENGPDGGAIFRVYLPRTDTAEKPHSSPAASQLAGDERILFVDDEPSLARLNQSHLERFGYKVTAVTSSRAALDIFQSDPAAFDLVITDQTMPEMTGDQLTAALLAIRSDLRVVLCTGYSETVNEETSRYFGISAFVMKPFKREELLAVIREVLDRQLKVVPG